MDIATQRKSDARMVGINYFNSEDYMINIVRRATSNHQDILLESDGHGELLVLASRGEYFTNLDNIESFCTLPVTQIKVSVLKLNDSRIPSVDKIGRNIDELMWQAAYYASAGRLMDGCYRDDMVKISHWPNLTRLPHTPNTARILALLTRHASSISFATRLLKIEAAEIYQIYSAARCAGLARLINRTPEEPRMEPHRNQTLLSALLAKITGL